MIRLRELEPGEVTFTVRIEPEDMPVRGNFASGDEALDKADEDAILERLERGETEAWCGVIVEAQWEGFKATDAIWAVSLGADETPESYAESNGMLDEARAALNARLGKLARKLSKLEVPESA